MGQLLSFRPTEAGTELSGYSITASRFRLFHRAATSAILRAYDASDLTDELYNSAQNATDTAGLGIKFTSPIVSNGKVFIGTGHDPASTTNPRGELDVYGLK